MLPYPDLSVRCHYFLEIYHLLPPFGSSELHVFEHRFFIQAFCVVHSIIHLFVPYFPSRLHSVSFLYSLHFCIHFHASIQFHSDIHFIPVFIFMPPFSFIRAFIFMYAFILISTFMIIPAFIYFPAFIFIHELILFTSHHHLYNCFKIYSFQV